MPNKSAAGHLAAGLTILIWGTTFISTKVLLEAFQPVEILFFRFLLGLCALFAACPRRLRGTTPRQELAFAAAGLCGVCLYYLLENIALTYTQASNVGVILSVAPFFTALLSRPVFRDEPPLGPGFLLGFLTAMAGICLLSFGGASLEVSPLGDLLALLAAAVWAVYSVLTRRISGFGYSTLLATRRVFCYGLLFMLPVLARSGFRLGAERLANPLYLANLLFLGLGASALCFVTWNFAVKTLGAVKTALFIYMVPVITTAASALILRETITPAAALGILLTLAGLGLSQNPFHKGGNFHGRTR